MPGCKKSSLGLSNLSGTDNWGWVEAWGDWDVVSSDLFVSISVRFSHSSANVSMFLNLELRADEASNVSISLSSCGSSGSRSRSGGSELSYALVRTFSRVLNFWASEEFSSVRFLQLILGREIGLLTQVLMG